MADYNQLIRQLPAAPEHVEISKADILRVMRHPLVTGQSPFAAKAVQIVNGHPFADLYRATIAICAI